MDSGFTGCVTATSHLDTATLKLGSALHLRHRHPVFVLFRYLYLALIPLGGLLIYLGEETFGILFVLLGPVLFLRKVFWQYRLIRGTKPDRETALHWTFDKEGFHQKAKGHERRFAWSEVTDRLLSPKGILLYLSPEQYFILPKQAFESVQAFEEVSTLVAAVTSSAAP